MTIVELLDKAPINNVIGALRFHPDKIIYIGGISKKRFETENLAPIRNFLAKKLLGSTEIEYVRVCKEDIQDIVSVLEKVYSENSDCRFNIEVTGGDDLILVGIGILWQRHAELKIFQVSSRLRNIKYFSLDPQEKIVTETVDFGNTVEENLILHGGALMYSDGSDNTGNPQWVFDENFVRQLGILWNISGKGLPRWKYESMKTVRSFPVLWSRFVNFISRLCSLDTASKHSDAIKVPSQTCLRALEESGCQRQFADYLDYLSETGIISSQEDGSDFLLKFDSQQVRRCLVKPGTVLELRTLLLCRNLLKAHNGDVHQGITIDWDGVIPSDTDGRFDPNTVNNVDIIAVHGLTPCFVSCKAGRFAADELYKLSLIADRFGTGYSKKVMITADIHSVMSESADILLQRAEDMGITVIDGVHSMTEEEFAESISTAFGLPKQRDSENFSKKSKKFQKST